MKKIRKKELTVEGLQDLLWDTLNKLKEKKITPQDANAVTMAAKEICNVTRLQLQHRALLMGPNTSLKYGDVPMLDRI